MIGRTLFIHAGGSKTGSTAIQKFLFNNAKKLEDIGLAFENRRTNEFGANNGMLLYNKLLSPSSSVEDIDNLVSSYFGQCDNAICTSEYFQLLQLYEWAKLYDSLCRLGIRLKIIMYVRNVIPYMLSSYDQAIKHHGATRSFDQWVTECDWGHADVLQIIETEFPDISIKVIHFDRARKNIIREFLDALGIDSSFEFDQQIQKHQVNRSLNSTEREILIKVNSTLGNSYCSELSDLLIKSNPNALVAPTFCDKATEGLLMTRFSKQVDWINSTYFNGQSIVSVFPMESKIKQEKNLMLEQTPNNATEKQVLDWALEKLKTIQNETECRILDSLNNAVSQNASKNYPPEVPADFDALAYLLLNPDVLHAGMDAVRHYIYHGNREGRPYKVLKGT
jgi:hypothetical protein